MKSSRGQGTVEYLLMLSVIVGVVLISGVAMKKFMPGMFSQIERMITDTIGQMGS